MIINLYVYNSIDSSDIMRVTMPWDYKKALKGFYSAMLKDLKSSCASSVKVDKRFIRVKPIWTKGKTDRLNMSLPSGVQFNAPFDLNATDFKIINLHLEALELSKTVTP